MATLWPTCSELDRLTSLKGRLLSVSPLLCVAGLLPVELLAFSIRFDAVSTTGPWVQVFGYLPVNGVASHVAIAVVAAAVLFRGHQLRASLKKFAGRIEMAHLFWLSLLAHLAFLAGFYRLSVIVFEGDTATRSQAGCLVAGWIAVRALAFVSWLSALVPITEIRSLGRPALRWFLPTIVVGVAACGAGQLTDQLWPPLARATFVIAKSILGLVYSTVVTEPQKLVVGTPTFAIQIAPMCSGYEGVGLVLVFLGVFLVLYRQELRFPRALLLLPLGVITIWLLNALRIALLVVVGTSISPSVALGGFHSQAGWLAFNGVALGLIGLAWNSPFFSNAITNSAVVMRRRANPAAPYLLPFLVLVATVMITSAFLAGGFDWFYPIRVFTAGAALAYFWQSYRQTTVLQWTWSWFAVAIGVMAFILWMALEPLASATGASRDKQAAALAALPTSLAALWLVFRTVGSIVTVPLCEELAFRGFLSRRLIAEDFASIPLGRFSWFSFVVSSVLFGLLHQRWLAGTLAGMLFAAAMYRRGRLADAVLAHATTNGLVSAYVLMSGNWSAWS